MSQGKPYNHVDFLSKIRTSYVDNNTNIFSNKAKSEQFELAILIYEHEKEKLFKKWMKYPIKINEKTISYLKKGFKDQNKNAVLYQGKLNQKKYLIKNTDVISQDKHEGINNYLIIKNYLTEDQLNKSPALKTFCLFEAELFEKIVSKKNNIPFVVACGSREISSGKEFIETIKNKHLIKIATINQSLITDFMTKLGMIAHDYDIALIDKNKSKKDIIKVYYNKNSEIELKILEKDYNDHIKNMESLCEKTIDKFLEICKNNKEEDIILNLNNEVKKIPEWFIYCKTYAHKDSQQFKQGFNNFL